MFAGNAWEHSADGQIESLSPPRGQLSHETANRVDSGWFHCFMRSPCQYRAMVDPATDEPSFAPDPPCQIRGRSFDDSTLSDNAEQSAKRRREHRHSRAWIQTGHWLPRIANSAFLGALAQARNSCTSVRRMAVRASQIGHASTRLRHGAALALVSHAAAARRRARYG
jgi:hypothetical protein